MGRASSAKAAHRDRGAYTIRPARPGDGEAVLHLLQLIEQDDAGQAAIISNTSLIDRGYTPPTAYGVVLNLVAENQAGRIVGALAAAPPVDWTETIEGIDAHVRQQLRSSLIEITGIATAPAARGHRLGHRLLAKAETTAAKAGCRLSVVTYQEHLKHLGPYYAGAGYTALADREPLVIRHGNALMACPHHDVRVAIKPLVRDVTITAAPPGLPAGIRRLVDRILPEPAVPDVGDGIGAILHDFCAMLHADLDTDAGSLEPSPAMWVADERFYRHQGAKLFLFMATTDLMCDILEQRASRQSIAPTSALEQWRAQQEARAGSEDRDGRRASEQWWPLLRESLELRVRLDARQGLATDGELNDELARTSRQLIIDALTRCDLRGGEAVIRRLGIKATAQTGDLLRDEASATDADAHGLLSDYELRRTGLAPPGQRVTGVRLLRGAAPEAGAVNGPRRGVAVRGQPASRSCLPDA